MKIDLRGAMKKTKRNIEADLMRDGGKAAAARYIELLSRQPAAAPPPPPPAKPLTPLTRLQKNILKALDGRALKKDPLAAACNVEPSRLYKAGGLTELREHKRVDHKPQVGFFRPDAMSPEMLGD